MTDDDPIAREAIERKAWADFERWCVENDPDGDLTPLEQVEAYANDRRRSD